MTVTVIAEDLIPSAEAQVLAGTVEEAAEAVGLRRQAGLVILINGRLAAWQARLTDGDVVEFMPALGGG